MAGYRPFAAYRYFTVAQMRRCGINGNGNIELAAVHFSDEADERSN
jgi:hypothetical protein